MKITRKKVINLIEVAHKLTRALVRFDNISQSSKNIGRLTFNTRENANACLSNLQLELSRLEAYVPIFIVFRKGVFRGIPTDLSMDKIKDTINGNAGMRVVDVFRLEKRAK